MKFKRYETSRGLVRILFEDFSKTACVISNSSQADVNCLRISTDNVYSGPQIHLTQAQVRELIPIFEKFVQTGDL